MKHRKVAESIVRRLRDGDVERLIDGIADALDVAYEAGRGEAIADAVATLRRDPYVKVLRSEAAEAIEQMEEERDAGGGS